MVIVCTVLISATGCKDNPLKVNVDDVDVSINFKRFDKSIFNIDTNNVGTALVQLKQQYPNFYPSYYNQILTLDHYNDSSLEAKTFKEFLAFKPTEELFGTIEKKFDNVEPYNKEITTAFKHYKYYFPNDSLPNIIYFPGILKYGCIYYGDNIAIGLDMYLGKDYPYESIMDLSNFLIVKMRPEYITRNVVNAMGNYRFNKFNTGKRFIDQLIYEGKIAYFIDAMMPDAADSIKLAFSGGDVEWCENNEWQMWQHMVDPKLKVLYNNDPDEINRYFEEGPFTNANGVPPESPARFVVWLGRQVVRQYMKNSKATLEQLMQETDSDKILRESKYKP